MQLVYSRSYPDNVYTLDRKDVSCKQQIKIIDIQLVQINNDYLALLNKLYTTDNVQFYNIINVIITNVFKIN